MVKINLSTLMSPYSIIDSIILILVEVQKYKMSEACVMGKSGNFLTSKLPKFFL
jgi:hypothetical protein